MGSQVVGGVGHEAEGHRLHVAVQRLQLTPHALAGLTFVPLQPVTTCSHHKLTLAKLEIYAKRAYINLAYILMWKTMAAESQSHDNVEKINIENEKLNSFCVSSTSSCAVC